MYLSNSVENKINKSTRGADASCVFVMLGLVGLSSALATVAIHKPQSGRDQIVTNEAVSFPL